METKSQPFRLTEWQRIKLKDHFILGYKYASEGMDLYSLADDNLAKIESILSEPEQPKYQPKKYDIVLMRDNQNGIWLVDVFCEMQSNGRYKGFNMICDQCRPFDPEIVGKVTD